MNLKSFATLALLVLGALSLATPQKGAINAPLQFINHLQGGMPEQDVFVEKVGNTGQVFRITDAEKDGFINATIFSTAKPTDHAPSDLSAIGPFVKGKSLGVTMGKWLAAQGSGSYQCSNGQATVKANFSGLIAGGVYTLWYVFSPSPPAQPFVSLDLPLGARSGAQALVKVGADGKASYTSSFKPCLQLGGEQALTLLALAYHSDGKTYGGSPGPFGSATHIQLIAMLPMAK
jgi:hypothetical protein